MIVGIVGTRYDRDPVGNAKVAKVVRYAVSLLGPQDIVLSGGAKSGADFWAKEEATRQLRQYLEAPPNWHGLKRLAGFARNGTIATVCTHLLAVWDGKSGGTLDTIKKAQALGKPVWVVLVDW